jgi:AraC-like DNA-binding protein
MRGSLSFTLYQDVRGDNLKGNVHAGQFMFFPAGCWLRYETIADATVLIFRLINDSCKCFSIEQLYEDIVKLEKQKILAPLQINARLQHFAEGILQSWEDGMRCTNYFEAEITKLLIMLPTYYSKEELFRFFYPIVSPNTVFSEYVRMNWRKYLTINKLSESMNMTPQQFSRQFALIFNQTPRDWIQKEKARFVYREICQSNKQFKEIADAFGFTDQSNFNRFCRKFFDKTPKELRKTE